MGFSVFHIKTRIIQKRKKKIRENLKFRKGPYTNYIDKIFEKFWLPSPLRWQVYNISKCICIDIWQPPLLVYIVYVCPLKWITGNMYNNRLWWASKITGKLSKIFKRDPEFFFRLDELTKRWKNKSFFVYKKGSLYRFPLLYFFVHF